MRTVIKNDQLIFHFDSPVTVEIQSDSLLIPPNLKIRQVVLDFTGVRAISSLAIGAILRLMETEKDRLEVRMENVGPELEEIFKRTGLEHILRNP
ncbi:MAG: STAS domain-containing protein [Spirochaetales bacterium]|nr:STAS domain-containing protein [Spirochaetales bacterium]